MKREVLASLDLRGHIGQLKLNALKVRDRLAELTSHRRIAQRVLESALGDPERQRGNADASRVERLHKIDEALALLTDEILDRNLDVLHNELGSVRCAPTELVFLLAGAKAFHARQTRLVADA